MKGRNLGRTGRDTRLTKAEAVWREIFPPQLGDWIEFYAQYEGEHRLMKGYITRVERNRNGIPFYTVRVTYMEPMHRWGKPKNFRLKGNARIKKLDEEPLIEEGN